MGREFRRVLMEEREALIQESEQMIEAGLGFERIRGEVMKGIL
jgi:hypothetical protein